MHRSSAAGSQLRPAGQQTAGHATASPTPSIGSPSEHGRPLTAVTVTIITSASVFAGIRAGLRSYGPFDLVAFRFILASLFLLALARPLHVRLPRRRDLPLVFALGFCGISVYQVALAIGEQRVSADVASMVVASETIMVAVLATIFLGERLSRWGWLGALIGFGGVAIISLDQGGGFKIDLQVLWPLLAALGTSVYFVFEKPLLRHYTALEMTTWCIWSGTIFVLPFAASLPTQIVRATWTATASVVYLAVIPGVVAYLAWTHAIAHAPASLVVNALCLVPPTAVVIAYFWLGERPSWVTLLGGAVTIAGVALVGLRGRPAAADRHRSRDSTGFRQRRGEQAEP